MYVLYRQTPGYGGAGAHKVLYIGVTSNIRTRLQAHYKAARWGPGDQTLWVATRSLGLRGHLEAFLCGYLRPTRNIASPPLNLMAFAKSEKAARECLVRYRTDPLYGWIVERAFNRYALTVRYNEMPIRVPAPTVSFPTIWRFAETYDAYHRDGGNTTVAAIANRYARQWRRSGELPHSLRQARLALFFEQRRAQRGTEPNSAYVRGLLARIDDLSGGYVPGPADPLP